MGFRESIRNLFTATGPDNNSNRPISGSNGYEITDNDMPNLDLEIARIEARLLDMGTIKLTDGERADLAAKLAILQEQRQKVLDNKAGRV